MQILFTLLIVQSLDWTATKTFRDESFQLETLKNPALVRRNNIIQIDNETIDPFFYHYRSANRARPRRHVGHRQSHRGFHPSRLTKHRKIREKGAERSHKLGKKREKVQNIVHSHLRRKINPVDYSRDDNELHDNRASKHKMIIVWEDWTDWTKCSVTCGSGRRVRWRHCVKAGCPVEGFKRAQLKSCRLKDCPKKGLFSWLGVAP